MRWLVLALALGALSWSAPAFADDAEEGSAAAHHDQGKAYFRAGAYAEAIAEFERGYDLDKSAGALFNIALAYEKLGDKARAAEYYERYLEQPTARRKTEARARATGLRKQLADEAARDAERAERAEKANKHVQAARRHMAAGRYTDAVANFRQAFQISSDPARVFDIAEAHRAAGEIDLAYGEYERYRTLAPTGSYYAAAGKHMRDLELRRNQPGPDDSAQQPVIEPAATQSVTETAVPTGGTAPPRPPPPLTDSPARSSSSGSARKKYLWAGYSIFALGYIGGIIGVQKACEPGDDPVGCRHGEETKSLVPIVGTRWAYSVTPDHDSEESGRFTSQSSQELASKLSLISGVVQVTGLVIAIIGHTKPKKRDSGTAPGLSIQVYSAPDGGGVVVSGSF